MEKTPPFQKNQKRKYRFLDKGKGRNIREKLDFPTLRRGFFPFLRDNIFIVIIYTLVEKTPPFQKNQKRKYRFLDKEKGKGL